MAVDLDNTLWQGTLVEDGPEELSLDHNILNQLALLRDRGIVTSIVSKNDADEASSMLQRLGVRDQFVFPEIDWRAKSRSLPDVFTLAQTIEEARTTGVELLVAVFRPSGRNDSARAALEAAGFERRDEESWPL